MSRTVPGTCGGSPVSRNPRQAWPSGGSESPISVSKKPWPRMSSVGCANSSSAGSDHLETDALAVGEDEVAADDLAQQRVERVDRLGGLGQHGVGRVRHGVHREGLRRSGQGVRTSLYRQM